MAGKLKTFLEMIKFEHTVFALPFAYLGYVLGARGEASWAALVWVTAAMVCARTAGMCLNRVIDRKIDALNPRTSKRAIVTGEIRASTAVAVALACLALLVYSAANLNPLCLYLSPVAVALLIAYHYLKRFTVLCHFGIGLVLAGAPMGGWIAATGAFEAGALDLGLAVLFWVAGFDIFYSLQDVESDRRQGIHSIAARFGIPRAVWVSRICHLLTLLFLIRLGIMFGSVPLYWAGLALVTLILAVEHVLVRGGRLDRIGLAFFTLNGVISTVFSLVASVSVLLRT